MVSIDYLFPCVWAMLSCFVGFFHIYLFIFWNWTFWVILCYNLEIWFSLSLQFLFELILKSWHSFSCMFTVCLSLHLLLAQAVRLARGENLGLLPVLPGHAHSPTMHVDFYIPWNMSDHFKASYGFSFSRVSFWILWWDTCLTQLFLPPWEVVMFPDATDCFWQKTQGLDCLH